MKVAIEARTLNSPTSAGVKTYARELIRSLQEIGGIELEIIDDTVPSWKVPWWTNVVLPQKLRALHPDVVHFTKAAVAKKRIAPTVVTIHDVIPILFPESQAWLQRLLWPKTLRHAARASDQIIVVSEATKRDLVEKLGVPPEKITVTQEAVDVGRFNSRVLAFPAPPSGAHETLRARRGTPGAPPATSPYVLFVSTRDQRKNIPLLIRAFSRLKNDFPHSLVIAGRPAQKRQDDKAEAARLGLLDRIKWLDFVPEEQLAGLYAGADLFVFPSIYEGWGLPPQEAMAAGVPVIVSDGGALPEVVGEAGEVVAFSIENLLARTHDAVFEERLAERMRLVLGDRAKHARMREAGLAWVQQFTWRRVAEKTLAVYKKAAAI